MIRTTDVLADFLRKHGFDTEIPDVADDVAASYLDVFAYYDKTRTWKMKIARIVMDGDCVDLTRSTGYPNPDKELPEHINLCDPGSLQELLSHLDAAIISAAKSWCASLAQMAAHAESRKR
jgi:hypothetical protein